MNVVPQRPDYPFAVGRLFDPDGSLRRRGGNAVLYPITSGNPGFAAIGSIQGALQQEIFADRFAFPPAASLHMTVFEGLGDEPHDRAWWPADMAGKSLREATAALAERLKGIEAPSSVRMRPKDLSLDDEKGSVITLEPGDSHEERRLRTFRDRLSELFGMHRPRHRNEVFQVSLSYLVSWPDAAEDKAIEKAHSALTAHIGRALSMVEFGPAEFCIYQDAFHFERVLELGSGAAHAGPGHA